MFSDRAFQPTQGGARRRRGLVVAYRSDGIRFAFPPRRAVRRWRNRLFTTAPRSPMSGSWRALEPVRNTSEASTHFEETIGDGRKVATDSTLRPGHGAFLLAG